MCYKSQKSEIFDNRRMLEIYCQNDIMVLRQACRGFRREFRHIGNIGVFLEPLTIASTCNEVLHKRFLQPQTIGHIPTGGYTGNNNYSKKAWLWLMHMEETDGVKILHCLNGR